MNPEKFPKCGCGASNWQPGGASIGCIMQHSFSCGSCGRIGSFLYADGQGYFFHPALNRTELCDWEIEYLNDILLVTCRARGEELKKAQQELEVREWQTFCQNISLPVDTDLSKLPDDHPQRENIRKFWCALHERRDYQIPPGFEEAVAPPWLPQTLVMYRLLQYSPDDWKRITDPTAAAHRILDYAATSGCPWKKVNHAESARLEVPADPIRTRHDAYFNPFFSALSEKLGVTIDRKEVPNQYCGHKAEPWYEFTVGELAFTVGPRKRVTAIKVSAPNGLPTARIRAAALADQVTYTANNGWQSDRDPARSVEVHAWNLEQLEKYLTILIGEALQPAAS